MTSARRSGTASVQVWTEQEWLDLFARLADAVERTRNDEEALSVVAPCATRVMRAYSSSFFVVTRFLPSHKRRMAELIYANVRYPDEIVDTFPLAPKTRIERLDRWGEAYERALHATTPSQAVGEGVPAFLGCFAAMVRARDIPQAYYRSFLDAMRIDVAPRSYATMEDLISQYVYGSAVVVGYLLTYAFGVAQAAAQEPALATARDLGIGLQMTNFLRDVWEDAARGRVYIPEDRCKLAGLRSPLDGGEQDARAWARLIAELADENDALYASALSGLSAFACDAQPAIRACIRVYRMLNDRLRTPDGSPATRASVPAWLKFSVLPPSKYWVLPAAFMVRR